MALYLTKACPVCGEPSKLNFDVGTVMDLRLGIPPERIDTEFTDDLIHLIKTGTHLLCIDDTGPDCE